MKENINFDAENKYEFKIGERMVGDGHPVFIIAELSGNHHHDINIAKKLIDAAREAGVDAVKLQTYTPHTITLKSDKEYFQIKADGAWKGQTLYSLYEKAYTPWEWHKELKEYAGSKGLMFFSTPFDPTAVDFLENLGVLFYKVASFEIVDIPLLKKIAETKKPVIISRGMSTLDEIQLALDTLRENGSTDVALLHCVSSYPANPSEMNLSSIPDIKKKFDVMSGLSDHSLDPAVSTLSVLLGASIIEKHIILRRKDGGPDAEFSIEPHEFADLVSRIRKIESIKNPGEKEELIRRTPNAFEIIGHPTYEPGENESRNIVFRKSIFIAKDVKKGDIFNKKNIRSVRPGHGLPPKHYEEILGKKATRDIEFGEPLDWGMVER